MLNVAIIGSGNIGSRHLQGLFYSKNKLNIFVIDSNNKSLKIAKDRYESIDTKKNNKLFYSKDIDILPKSIDLGIIATTASVRFQVLQFLLKNIKINNLILEKIVFQRAEHFYIIEKELNKRKINTWINCPRRSYSIYKYINKIIANHIIEVTVEYRNWGLGCNSIHMIDLFFYLTDQKKISYDNTKLIMKNINSKRGEYKELSGEFSIESSRGDILKIIDHENSSKELLLTIKTSEYKIIINENKKILYIDHLGTKEKKENIDIPFQSMLTGFVADKIFSEGKCELVKYSDCMVYHIPMIESFNNHFSKIYKKKISVCPIT